MEVLSIEFEQDVETISEDALVKNRRQRQKDILDRIAAKQKLTPQQLAIQPMIALVQWLTEEVGAGVNESIVESAIRDYLEDSP